MSDTPCKGHHMGLQSLEDGDLVDGDLVDGDLVDGGDHDDDRWGWMMIIDDIDNDHRDVSSMIMTVTLLLNIT